MITRTKITTLALTMMLLGVLLIACGAAGTDANNAAATAVTGTNRAVGTAGIVAQTAVTGVDKAAATAAIVAQTAVTGAGTLAKTAVTGANNVAATVTASSTPTPAP